MITGNAPGEFLRAIKVEREDCAVDGFVYQISVNRRIGNLHHSLTKRRAGLRGRSRQRRDGECVD